MSLLDPESELIDKITTKELIIEWLEKYDIENYNINDDFTIDVDDDVDLYEYFETKLPDYIQFNKVVGCFNIANSQIENLKGCPKIVKCDFNCSWCKNLKILEGAPEIVNNDFYCCYCSNLKTLKGAPKQVKKGFYCYGCPKLKTTEFDYKKHKIIK